MSGECSIVIFENLGVSFLTHQVVQPVSSKSSVSIQWVGDIGLTGEFLEPSNHSSLLNLANWLSENLEKPHLRIGNWETPLKGCQGRSRVDKIHIFTDEMTARQILPFKIDVVTLANNHFLDCCDSGAKITMSYFRTNSVYTVGAGETIEVAQAPLNLTIKDIPFTILSYVDLSTSPGISRDTSFALNILAPQRVFNDVKHWSKKGRIVIVNCHWGDEYLPNPSLQQRAVARKIIESGASIIVGHHPHRLQGYEKWENGYIFYSLGNFLFGDTGLKYCWPSFSHRTAVVTCDFDSNGVRDVRMRHLFANGFTVRNEAYAKGKRLQDNLNRWLNLPDNLYKSYYRIARKYNKLFEWPIEIIKKNGWSIFTILSCRKVKQYLRQI